MMSEGNQKCKNCRYEAGHHSSSSGMCPTPDGTTYYEAKEEVNFTPKPHFVFTGWRAPKDPVRIKVPEGMLQAGRSVYSVYATAEEGARVILEAALRWLSENPIVPTDGQIFQDSIPYDGNEINAIRHHVVGFQRRMFLAPEPEVPEEIKDLLYDPKDGPNKVDRNDAIIEAYRRGQRRSGQNSQARQ
jgi:hypothetical protein